MAEPMNAQRVRLIQSQSCAPAAQIGDPSPVNLVGQN
jgi:hypothetical protein